jgi:hypothetical protein
MHYILFKVCYVNVVNMTPMGAGLVIVAHFGGGLSFGSYDDDDYLYNTYTLNLLVVELKFAFHS